MGKANGRILVSLRWAALLTVLTTVGMAWAAHQEVWVATDRTVDCTSLETILRDVIKPDMNNEQKAVALFTVFRRLVFHHLNTAESRDPVKLFNILGYTLCGSQGTVNKALCKAAGFDARVVCGPGHTFYEVKYDDRWHVMDTFMNFYVYTRGEDKHIADMDELKADPTLATKALAEGRACPGFLMCGDGTGCFTAGRSVLAYEPSKSSYSPRVLRLYKGMEFTRTWTCGEKASPGGWQAGGFGARHTCGGKDSNSAENFIWWEPYLVRNFASSSRSYRHYASGRVSYAPDLRAGEWQDSADAPANLVSGKEGEPALHPLEAGKDAVWSFCLQTPYYITDGFLELKVRKKNPDDVLAVEVSVDRGTKWNPVWSATEVGDKTERVDLSKAIVKACPGHLGYNLRCTLKASKEPSDVGLDAIYLRTCFQHNMMATPALLPGKNKATVTAKPVKEGDFTPFDVIYEYQEGPQWDSAPVKNVTWTVKEPTAAFEAELPECAKHHKMKTLTYRCTKLNWVPEDAADKAGDRDRPEGQAAPPAPKAAPKATEKPAEPAPGPAEKPAEKPAP